VTDGPVPVWRAAAWALLLAAAYYLIGRLGLLLAIPPGYASAVWPPAGIALAGVLLGGWRVAPGIWLGSFLLNVGTGFSPDAPLLSYGVTALIALGATAQAGLGAWLIRWRGYPTNMLSAGSGVVPLLVLGGPLACLLSASVAVASLWLVGRMPGEAVPFNWWTWWIGDSIGVLLFAPLVLVWSVRPWGASLRRQLYVTLPLVLLFAVVVALFVFIAQREQARIDAEFRVLAADIHQSLRTRLENTLAVLSSIEGFYASSHEVEPYEFEIFAQRLIKHLDGISALSWNPVVPHAGRAAFEARARRSGLEGYRITERAPEGSLRPAARRAHYVPIEIITPRTGNERALGFDTASEPLRREIQDEARDTGQAVATGLVELAQRPEQTVLVVLPVYRLGAQDYTLDARRRYLKGFAVALFSFEALMRDATRRAAAGGLGVALLDRTELGTPTLLHGVASASPADLRETFAFSFARRSWQLELTLAEQAVVARRSWGAWLVLAGGLLLTVLLGILLLAGVGRTAQVEALVAERTEALRQTGAQLARSNRELEQYAYVTSHDLKAPLRTIASFAQLLVQRHGAKLEGEAREFLDFIQRGTERMQELIDALLQLSRVDARRLELSPVSMRVAVDRACGALAADLENSHARVQIAELPFVRGDLHTLAQLWQNLIANAIKFQRPSQAPDIHISATERPEDWAFSIADNGIGIAAAHREQVFFVFRRLHTQEDYPGTGIGLAICKKVVQLHGGEIWVEPGAGSGTTVSFTLPKTLPPA
jgi:signal transduction histidine kinase